MTRPSEITERATTDRIVEHLAARWREVDTTTLFPAFALLARGLRPSAAQVAEAAGGDPARAARALASDRLGLDAEGRLVELFGVSSEPWTYRVAGGDGAADLSTCCALIAAAVPSLLGRSVTIEGADPISDETVRWRIDVDGTGGKTASTTPRTMAATLVRTELEAVLGDAYENFCRHVRLFASPETADRFAALDRRRFVVGLDELHDTARALYDAVWAEARS